MTTTQGTTRSKTVRNQQMLSNELLFPCVEGWLIPEERRILMMAGVAVDSQDGVIVEIGSYRGLSSLCIAAGIHQNPTKPLFYSIDPHDGLGVTNQKYGLNDLTQCYRNFGHYSTFGQYINKLTTYSMTAARMFDDEEVALLFIDGDHSELGVTEDLNAWLQKVVIGGGIFFHDWELESVRAAAGKFSKVLRAEESDPSAPNLQLFTRIAWS